MGRPVPLRLRHERVASWSGAVYAGGIAGILALIAVAAGWRGSDLPAQMFRVELLRRNGFVLWDSQWFAGHSTLNYSVLSPVLGALTGPVALGALCGVISAILFDRLLRDEFGSAAWFGSLWFAVATVTRTRRTPVQRRSRERVERILRAAEQLGRDRLAIGVHRHDAAHPGPPR